MKPFDTKPNLNHLGVKALIAICSLHWNMVKRFRAVEH